MGDHGDPGSPGGPGGSGGSRGSGKLPAIRPADRGLLQAAFAQRVDALLRRAGRRPVVVGEADRGRAFGPGGFRRLIEPHYWAVLEGAGGTTTLMATADASISVLEESVARFVWWASEWKPFWRSPALLVSGVVRLSEEDEVHGTVARFLGDELTRLVPDLRHVMVEAPAGATIREAGRALADRAVQAVAAVLGEEATARWDQGREARWDQGREAR
ncbi:MAG: hypothetical protein HY658_09835 [Actinobacteria bacterium]|nr:hypothetical protein [Actinomycetota bacterium]